MALDIHVLDDRGRQGDLLHQIEFESYQGLLPAWRLFEKRTGLFIDPYSNMVFSSGLKPLIQALVDARHAVSAPIARKDLEILIGVLAGAEDKRLSIGFFGD